MCFGLYNRLVFDMSMGLAECARQLGCSRSYVWLMTSVYGCYDGVLSVLVKGEQQTVPMGAGECEGIEPNVADERES